MPIDDITPPFKPISLARTMVEVANKEGAVAAFCLVSFEDGGMWLDSAGVTRKDVLWALEQAKLRLFGFEP